MKFARIGVAIAAAAIVVSACGGSSTSSSAAAPAGNSAAPAGTMDVKVGIELPMTGGEAPNGVPTANGVALALDQIKVPGFNVTINQQDDAVNGKHNADQGAKNMTALANDAAVMFVVGPVQLQRRPGRDPGQQRVRHDAVQPGQHRGGAHEGRRRPEAPPDQPRQDRLRPRRHHRRQPGRRHRRHRLQHRRREDRLRPRRHPDVRQGPRQGLHGRLHDVGRHDRRLARACRTPPPTSAPRSPRSRA